MKHFVQGILSFKEGNPEHGNVNGTTHTNSGLFPKPTAPKCILAQEPQTLQALFQ